MTLSGVRTSCATMAASSPGERELGGRQRLFLAALQLGRHGVERFGELADLVARPHRQQRQLEVRVRGDAAGGARHLVERPHDLARQQSGDGQPDREDAALMTSQRVRIARTGASASSRALDEHDRPSGRPSSARARRRQARRRADRSLRLIVRVAYPSGGQSVPARRRQRRAPRRLAVERHAADHRSVAIDDDRRDALAESGELGADAVEEPVDRVSSRRPGPGCRSDRRAGRGSAIGTPICERPRGASRAEPSGPDQRLGAAAAARSSRASRERRGRSTRRCSPRRRCPPASTHSTSRYAVLLPLTVWRNLETRLSRSPTSRSRITSCLAHERASLCARSSAAATASAPRSAVCWS